MLKDENWYFCENCNCISYHYDCCGNAYCNAGGCEDCHDVHKEVREALRVGNHPHPILPPLH